MEIKTRTIVIKPVKRAKFSGHSSYPNAAISIDGAAIDKNGYKTGLTKAEELEFCEALGLPKNTLSKNVNHPYKENDFFWGNVLNMRLPRDKDTVFVVDSLMDEIKLRVLLNRENIAENEVELKKKPYAEFYIDDVEAKAKVEEIIINHKMEALDSLRTLSLDEKKGFLKLYGKRGLNDVSEAFVQTTLFKEVDANPEKFIALFNNPDIKVRIEIEEMIEAGILLKKGNFYVYQNETLGNSVEAVIAYFKDLRNQSQKIAAKQAVKDSKK